MVFWPLKQTCTGVYLNSCLTVSYCVKRYSEWLLRPIQTSSTLHLQDVNTETACSLAVHCWQLKQAIHIHITETISRPKVIGLNTFTELWRGGWSVWGAGRVVLGVTFGWWTWWRMGARDKSTGTGKVVILGEHLTLSLYYWTNLHRADLTHLCHTTPYLYILN